MAVLKQGPGSVLVGLLISLLVLARAMACDLATAPTSQWRVSRAGDRAWLIDPCGGTFYSLGVNVVDGGAPARVAHGKTWYSWRGFSPSLSKWAGEADQRLTKWGFNTLGGWSLPPDQIALPQIPNLDLGRLARFHWFDPFDPETGKRMTAIAHRLAAPYRNHAQRIGYFLDNEVGWWGGTLFMYYQHLPPTNYTKQHWVAFLQRSYRGAWNQFLRDFQPPAEVGSWNALLLTTRPTYLRPGSNGIQMVRAWTGIVAERYYSLAEQAVRAADPEALIFGDRLPIYYDPDAVRAEARHVDVIAVNYNVDSPEGYIAPYFFDGLHRLSGGKPILISEWFFAARENRSGNTNNGHLMTVMRQTDRAIGAAQATQAFASLPDIVGTHWFQYADYPKGGRADGEDYNFGLVDIDNRPYEALTAALSASNRYAAERHATARLSGESKTAEDFTIPHAEIDFGAHSLLSWPKQRSLLPALRTLRGEIPFGEAYLAWNKDGLAVATIGQDYYDLSLLGPYRDFPLSQSYKIQIGVDLGAGPRWFSLVFIPPRQATKGTPQMRTLLCQGMPETERSCVAVAGGKAAYFGADQPRITAQMRIPWSSLGISARPSGRRLRVEVAATAWYGSRWMSLTGQSPDLHADSRSWPLMTLEPYDEEPSAPDRTP